MRGGAFIPLNGGGLNLTSGKQTKISVAGLLKILRICPFCARRMLVKTEVHKFRLYLQQILAGMANLHRTAVFVSQITALTRNLAQGPAQQRKRKIVQALMSNSILGITSGNFQTMIGSDSIFEHSIRKTSVFKTGRKLFHGFGCVIRITQRFHKQEMVSRRTY